MRTEAEFIEACSEGDGENIRNCRRAGERSGGGRSRRPMSREAYRAMQKRKKRAARRRKRLQRIRLVFMLAIMVTLLGVLGNLAADMGAAALSHISLPEALEKFLGRGEPSEVYRNADAYPEALLEALERNPELEEFVKGYLASDGSVTGGIRREELEQDFPLLLQYDSRWGYAPFGDDNIALSGCAPACMSMVITALKKTAEAPPDVVADFCEKEGYYEKGVGTSWSLMMEGCLEFGVRGQELGLDKDLIFSRLEEGQPVICSMRPGDFTATGHFIVLVGVEDGRLRVNDPFSRERSSRLWEFEQIEHQIKNLWAFTLVN